MSTLTPYYADDQVTLLLGDCRSILPTLVDASVDAVVTDPPYELGFMGKAWDASGVAYDAEVWRQCWRVLKPGGHLVAFGAPRTYHRLAVAIEDAGFEIRDSLHWIYGSGMPKGQNIGKAVDRHRDDRTQVLQVTAFLAAARDAAGWTTRRIDDLFGFNGMASHWTAIASKAASVPTMEQWVQLREALGFTDNDVDALVAELNGRKGNLGEAWAQREVTGQGHRVRGESDVQIAPVSTGDYDITAPATDAARQWHGWNTQLRPAHEPIILARKSTGFDSTVANVLRHGTGALNIDATRTVAGQDYRDKCASVVGIDSPRNGDTGGERYGAREDSAHTAGRWPTNVVLSHGPDCADRCAPGCPVSDLGAEARFFPVFRYEAKAPASERPRLADGTAHPTVKPVSLMSWLVRLVTPPAGLVLDPFAGSGTTLEAAVAEGMRTVGIEQHQPYADLCVARLAKPIALGLFGEVTS